MNYRSFLLLPLLLISAHILAEDKPAERLTAILERTTTLTASIDQLTLDQQGREVQASRAELKMRKPDHFHWQTLEPYEETLVTNGELLWIYEPDLEQVSIEHFNASSQQTPAMLLSSDAETLAADYDISVSETGDGRLRFLLLPLQADALFTELSLTFHDEQLEEMQFEDSLGQRSSLYFESVRRNQILADEVFEFAIPPGVEVIDSRGGQP